MSKRITKIVNSRMLKIMEYAIDTGKVRNKTAWCKAIGLHSQNLATQIIPGRQAFTHEQIYAAVKMVGASFDFVYGQTDVMKKTTIRQQTPADLIWQALIMMEK